MKNSQKVSKHSEDALRPRKMFQKFEYSVLTTRGRFFEHQPPL